MMKGFDMWKDVPIRKGGWVEWVDDKPLASGNNLSGLGRVLSIDGDYITVDCMYNGKVVVKREYCHGCLGE